MKKVLLLVVAVIMMLSLVACSAAPEGEKPAGDGEKPADIQEFDVVYLTPSTASQYWQYNEIGIRNAIVDIEAEHGVKINFTVAGPAEESETDAYINAFEDVISRQPDAIITATLTAEATVAKTKEAAEQGIYVNFVGLGIGDEYSDYFGTFYNCDNWTIGETAAKAFLDALEAKGLEPKGIVGIHMNTVVETLEGRMNGFKAYMAENAPDLVCLDTLYNENDVNNAQANAETQISTYGDELIGFFAANNLSGDGVALAVKNAGIGDKIVSVAVDSDDLEIEALKAGNLDAIVVQTPYEQGYTAMMNAFTYLTTGENPDPSHLDCPSSAVTKANMEETKYAGLLDPTILINY